MNSRPPTPPNEVKRRMQWSFIVIIWIVVGIAWSCTQFLICEVTYRMGNQMSSEASEALYGVSDTVAWPASLLYDQAMGKEYVMTIQESLQNEDSGLVAEDHAKLRELLDQYQGDYGNLDFQEEAEEVLSGKDIYPELDLVTEYSIYGGICIAWGALIAILGCVATLMIRLVGMEPGRMT